MSYHARLKRASPNVNNLPAYGYSQYSFAKSEHSCLPSGTSCDELPQPEFGPEVLGICCHAIYPIVAVGNRPDLLFEAALTCFPSGEKSTDNARSERPVECAPSPPQPYFISEHHCRCLAYTSLTPHSP